MLVFDELGFSYMVTYWSLIGHSLYVSQSVSSWHSSPIFLVVREIVSRRTDGQAYTGLVGKVASTQCGRSSISVPM